MVSPSLSYLNNPRLNFIPKLNNDTCDLPINFFTFTIEWVPVALNSHINLTSSLEPRQRTSVIIVSSHPNGVIHHNDYCISTITVLGAPSPDIAHSKYSTQTSRRDIKSDLINSP
jgi:hypothetical protein